MMLLRILWLASALCIPLSCVSSGQGKTGGEASFGDFSGTWMTDDTAVRTGGFFGTIILKQKGDRVTGLFAQDQWSLSGTVTGRILKGRWWWNSIGDATFEETMPQFRGEMEWTLSEDGSSFSGWGRFGDGSKGVWTGKRIHRK